MTTVSFEQATIKVKSEKEYVALQLAVEHAFQPSNVERFLKQLDRKGIRVRDFDAVLAQRVLEGFADAGLNAQAIYGALPLSDQGRVRRNWRGPNAWRARAGRISVAPGSDWRLPIPHTPPSREWPTPDAVRAHRRACR